MIYNYDTEVVQVKGEDSYETIMACTGNCTGLGDSETENMVWGPDNFYVATTGRCRDRKRRRVTDTRGKTKICGNHLHLFNKDRGLKNVSSIIGSVSGMAECYHLGKGAGLCRFAPIYCETGKGNGVIKGVSPVSDIPN